MGDVNDKDTLDYDKMKIEETSTRNGDRPGEKAKELPIDLVISDSFKPKKLKDTDAALRKYIESFIGYEERAKAKELIVEEDENFPTPGAFFATKIDKVAYYKELQRCMNKWNKNKASQELNEVFVRLIKDASESESMRKLTKDNMSTYSAPSVKEDTKRKKKGSQHLSAAAINMKDVKELPSLRKMTDSTIDPSTQASTKESKKQKEKENIDELCILYYETPLKDQEFEIMFKNSVLILL